MTKEEFKEKAVTIYQSGLTEENRKTLSELLVEAKQVFPLKEVAMMAAEALDEAFPTVVDLVGRENTATARMARRFAAY